MEVNALAAQIMAEVIAVVEQMAAPYIAAAVEREFGPGGSIYSKIVGLSIAAASGWYGMYKPKVYRRGWTFTDESNIAVSVHDIQSNGKTWGAGWDVENQSSHAGYSDGFMMRNGEYRPGGYIVANNVNIRQDIEMPQDEVEYLFRAALAQVLGV